MAEAYLKTEANSRKGIGFKKRVCLTCGKPFLSEWVGNRLCQSCKGGRRSVGIQDVKWILPSLNETGSRK